MTPSRSPAPLHRRMAALTTALALAASLLTGLASPVRASASSARDATQLLELINRERASDGDRALTLHSRLSALARAHSREMARNAGSGCSGASLHHRRPSDRGVGSRAEYVGENVGCNAAEGMSEARQTQWLHELLMDSPTHRRNILEDRASHVGIGTYRDGEHGLWVTQVFVELDDDTPRGAPQARRPADAPAPEDARPPSGAESAGSPRTDSRDPEPAATGPPGTAPESPPGQAREPDPDPPRDTTPSPVTQASRPADPPELLTTLLDRTDRSGPTAAVLDRVSGLIGVLRSLWIVLTG